MTALRVDPDESKEILREKAISYLKGMLNQKIDESSDKHIIEYKLGQSLRPADEKLAKTTEKNAILMHKSKPFTIEDILNEILDRGEYSSFFVEMITSPRVNVKDIGVTKP